MPEIQIDARGRRYIRFIFSVIFFFFIFFSLIPVLHLYHLLNAASTANTASTANATAAAAVTHFCLSPLFRLLLHLLLLLIIISLACLPHQRSISSFSSCHLLYSFLSPPPSPPLPLFYTPFPPSTFWGRFFSSSSLPHWSLLPMSWVWEGGGGEEESHALCSFPSSVPSSLPSWLLRPEPEAPTHTHTGREFKDQSVQWAPRVSRLKENTVCYTGNVPIDHLEVAKCLRIFGANCIRINRNLLLLPIFFFTTPQAYGT